MDGWTEGQMEEWTDESRDERPGKLFDRQQLRVGGGRVDVRWEEEHLATKWADWQVGEKV